MSVVTRIGKILIYIYCTYKQGAIQKFEYVSNCALSSGAICLKILPFDCLSLCHVVFSYLFPRWRKDILTLVRMKFEKA